MPTACCGGAVKIDYLIYQITVYIMHWTHPMTNHTDQTISTNSSADLQLGEVVNLLNAPGVGEHWPLINIGLFN